MNEDGEAYQDFSLYDACRLTPEEEHAASIQASDILSLFENSESEQRRISELADVVHTRTSAREKVRRSSEARARRLAAATPGGGLPEGRRAIKVGLIFRRQPDRWFSELELCEATKSVQPVLYPIVRQFVEAGWLLERWETGAPEGEPRMKFYRASEEGSSALGLMIASNSTATPKSRYLFGFLRPKGA
ncbi:hypothetical protein [Streptomyces resistomycificus]|uniref:hypothetical protein n=1 Tax=Streptomyces resistomycificus TaxID=67356 RepID=UPI000FE26A13|nr:hypothetical protein [Streptomyces resistomycificus]